MTTKPGHFPAFWTECVTVHLDAKWRRVDRPLVYGTLIENDHGPALMVPAGFVTDFASINRPLWGLLPRDGTYGPAAVLHDWLYSSGVVTRAQADAIFLEAMEYCGTLAPVRRVMWFSVRAFGWLFYEKKRKSFPA